ncbi:uncharacterized protein EDB91DRAFT_1169782, partial [Suillus paluster]|uniref:uncharacterized protein n=1 Tax=Suillus paluster TaxID=48578 RepID=UPI001B879EF4
MTFSSQAKCLLLLLTHLFPDLDNFSFRNSKSFASDADATVETNGAGPSRMTDTLLHLGYPQLPESRFLNPSCNSLYQLFK